MCYGAVKYTYIHTKSSRAAAIKKAAVRAAVSSSMEQDVSECVAHQQDRYPACICNF